MALATSRRSGSVAVVTIERPESLNALNSSLLGELTDIFVAISRDRDVRSVLLTGAGDRAFVAGADIDELSHADTLDAEILALKTSKMHESMRNCPQPIIAAVNGYCLGGGMELALACDLCVASDKARFGLPEIKLGVLPGGGGTVRLAQIAGLTVARALAMSGDVISAERAYQIGLVHAVYPAAEVSSSTLALAEQLASLPPIAMAQLKSVFNSIADASAQGSFIVERKGFAICFATEDQKEGTKAFLEKRQPTFIGR